MNEEYIQAVEILKKHKQDHIIKYLSEEKVVKQVLNIDFNEMEELYQEANNEQEIDISTIEPIKAINPQKLKPEEITDNIKIGENCIKSGKFAVAIMAGGQGTRLRA